jgi:metal-responsive CopG/Arc/MetJ family transcriptional regulator
MPAFTTSLPDDLLRDLAQRAEAYGLPRNRFIERALRIYLEQLDKAEFRASYQRMAQDPDTLQLAEEGMVAYLEQLSDGRPG